MSKTDEKWRYGHLKKKDYDYGNNIKRNAEVPSLAEVPPPLAEAPPPERRHHR